MKIYYQYASDPNPELASEIKLHILHKVKYRIMWELRHLEERINDEDGVIIINVTGESELRDFSDKLIEDIQTTIKAIDWNHW